MKLTRRKRQKMNKQNGTISQLQPPPRELTPLQQQAVNLQKLEQMINEQAAQYAGQFHNIFLNAALKLLDKIDLSSESSTEDIISGFVEVARMFTEEIRTKGDAYTKYLMNAAPINADLQHMHSQTVDAIKKMETDMVKEIHSIQEEEALDNN